MDFISHTGIRLQTEKCYYWRLSLLTVTAEFNLCSSNRYLLSSFFFKSQNMNIVICNICHGLHFFPWQLTVNYISYVFIHMNLRPIPKAKKSDATLWSWRTAKIVSKEKALLFSMWCLALFAVGWPHHPHKTVVNNIN